MADLRKWTIWNPADNEDAPPIGPRVTRVWSGPTPAPGERIEALEANGLRDRLEAELLPRETTQVVARVDILAALDEIFGGDSDA